MKKIKHIKHINITLVSIFLIGYIYLGQINIHSEPENKRIIQDNSLVKDTSACVVYASFIVSKKGKTKHVKVDSCLCDSTYEYIESIKKKTVTHIQGMNYLKPKKSDGKRVNTRFTMAMRFNISQDTTDISF